MELVKLKAVVQDFNSDLWRFHLVVPEKAALKFINEKGHRVVCILPEGERMHTALMKRRDKYFILLNKRIVNRYKLAVDATIEIILTPEIAEFGSPMPEELDAVFVEEEKAYEAFMSLTPGKRRSLMYIVSKVKRVDSRIKKALAIAEHLTEAGTNIDYKRLNELIKKYNRSDIRII